MSAPRYAWCAGCGGMELVGKHWLALWIDSDGNLMSTQPERGCDLDYERAGTVFACGQTAALVLYERYLHSGGFTLPANLNPDQPGDTGDVTIQQLTEILYDHATHPTY